MKTLQTRLHETKPDNDQHEFTVDRSTGIYLESARECIDARAADAHSEIASAIRIVRRIADEFCVDERFEQEFNENLQKATLALAAGLGHVLEIVENTKELGERVGSNDTDAPSERRRKRDAA